MIDIAQAEITTHYNALLASGKARVEVEMRKDPTENGAEFTGKRRLIIDLGE